MLHLKNITSLRSLLIVMAVICCTFIYGQFGPQYLVQAGDDHYENMAYALAAEQYQRAADIGATNDHVATRLADCYRRLGNTERAAEWYDLVVRFSNSPARSRFFFAEMLKSNEKYEEAEVEMDTYLKEVNAADKRSNISDYAYKLKLEQDRYHIHLLDANTIGSEFGPIFYGRGVIFCSNRAKDLGIRRVDAFSGAGFMDLFQADLSESGEFVNIRPMEGKVNGPLHDGPGVPGNSGEFYFTRSSTKTGKAGRSQKGVTTLNIYSAKRVNEQWKNITAFEYNNNECSVGHPALSPSGEKLYFVSDMPGGYGGTDIYYCERQGTVWAEPQNAGPVINTPENETFPYVHLDGSLYFASNGHPGLGGLDVFVAKPNTSGKFDMVINMGFPLNGPKDDFGLVMDEMGRSGYFSSNRPGGVGGDDLYRFEMKYPLEPSYVVTGRVFEENTNRGMEGVEVVLYSMDEVEIAQVTTGQDGKYSFEIENNKSYKLVGRAEGFLEDDKYLMAGSEEQLIVRDMEMTRNKGIVLKGVARYLDGNELVERLKVSLIDLETFGMTTEFTDEGGGIKLRLKPEHDYQILFEKEGYFSVVHSVNTIGLEEPAVIDLNDRMDLRIRKIEPGVPITIEGLQWAYQSSNLDAAGKSALTPLVELLRNNPHVHIEIASHTDSRGDDANNLALSQARAEAVMRYLSSRSILTSKMNPVGYGETKPKNHCTNGIQCTEAEHRVNRRTEFSVMEF